MRNAAAKLWAVWRGGRDRRYSWALAKLLADENSDALRGGQAVGGLGAAAATAIGRWLTCWPIRTAMCRVAEQWRSWRGGHDRGLLATSSTAER